MTQPNRIRSQRKLQRLRSTVDKCFLRYAHSAPLARACLAFRANSRREMPKTRIAEINADVGSGVIYHRLFFSGHKVWKYAKPAEAGKYWQTCTANKHAKGAAGADMLMNGRNRFLRARISFRYTCHRNYTRERNKLLENIFAHCSVSEVSPS